MRGTNFLNTLYISKQLVDFSKDLNNVALTGNQNIVSFSIPSLTNDCKYSYLKDLSVLCFKRS